MRGVPALAGLALAFAPVAVPAGAHAAAAPKPCVAIQDGSGDVGPADVDAGTWVPDFHLDVLQVTMRATPANLVVVVQDMGLDSSRRGQWTVEFAVRGTRMYVTADLGVWADLGGARSGDGAVTFRAGLVGGPARGITGKFDYGVSTLTLTVPYTAYGGALAPASVLRNVQAESRETFVVPPETGARTSTVTLADTAVRRLPLALSTCR